MKQFSRREFLLRIVSSSSEAVLFYLGYMFINQIFNGTKINILFFIFVALCGLLVNLVPYNSSDKRRQSILYSVVGLVLAAIVTAVNAIIDFNLFSIPLGFAALIWLYYRQNMSFLYDTKYLYSMGAFNRGIGLLFFINALAAYLGDNYYPISDQLLRYAVLYIIMGIYMLTEIKHFKYVSRSENNKKTSFDIAATVSMLALTVIMSIPKVFAVVTKPFVVVFGFVYGLIMKVLIWASIPFGIVVSYFYRFVHMGEQNPEYEELFKKKDALVPKDPNLFMENTDDNMVNIIQIFGKVLAFLFLLGICAYLLYVLFQFIDRRNRSKNEEDFEEDKEFVRRRKISKRPGLIKRIGETVRKAAEEIAFSLTADNAGKLRNEYKDFIKKLHNKKIIEHYNYTALDILEITSRKAPSQKTILEGITSMYEEVRYGVKYPQDNELKTFRKNLTEASKAIFQS